jgi:hypothetical protein
MITIDSLDIKFGIIPPKNFLAITFFGTIYINKRNKEKWENLSKYDKLITYNHEMIHLKQAKKEGSWIKYYCKYIWYWLRAIFLSCFNNDIAYYCNPYEIESYLFQKNLSYNLKYNDRLKRIKISQLVDLKKSLNKEAFLEAIKAMY